MRLPFLYISFILWLLAACSGNIVPVPLACNCPNASITHIDSISDNAMRISWQKLWNVHEYEVKTTNIQTNQDTIFSFVDTTNTYPNTFHKNINSLLPGSLYDIKIRAVCARPYHCKYGDWSAATFLVSDNTGNCAQPVNFAVFEVKKDTLTLAWQNVAGIDNYVISMTDSVGNLVFHQNYTDVSPISSPIKYGLLKSNLPDGDYTIWIQSDCGSELSLPSNIGVFTMRNGGNGSVIVIDDNIDIYAPSNCSTCAVNFPTFYPNVDVIAARSMTFANRNTPPQQILMGFQAENNSSINCAPTAANTWRIKSLRVHAPYFNMPTSDYRISLPAIKCVCAGEHYNVRVIARNTYLPFSGGVAQICN